MIGSMTVELETPRLKTLSPSRAGDFKTCPQLFKFRAVDRLPEPTSIYQARGTTAHLALKLWNPTVETTIVDFDRILDVVADGEVDAGVVIHEGQLTYRDRRQASLECRSYHGKTGNRYSWIYLTQTLSSHQICHCQRRKLGRWQGLQRYGKKLKYRELEPRFVWRR